MQKTKIALFICSVFVIPSFAVYAQESSETNEADTLETIVVSETSFSQQIGTQKITEKEMERRPTTNGNITDLLKINPNVRFSGESDASNNGGEISPSEVSFHGEKFYNNNYIINGMSNNDNLNPGSSAGNLADKQPSGTNPHDLPAGGTQSFWINTNLLKNVEAFDSNISSKYGNFTGGVINAELKDPDFEKQNSGRVYYRVTRDEWTSFHSDNEENFNKATELDNQPDYLKQQAGVFVNRKFSDKFSMLFSYDRTISDIQYYHPLLQTYDADRKLSPTGSYANVQKRRAETYLLKGIYLPDNGDLWRATVIYAPHRSKFFKRNVVNGAFTNTGGGAQVNIEWEKQFDKIKMTTYAGYKRTGNTVEHDRQHYNAYQASDYLDWVSNSGVAQEGGYGKFKSQKDIYTFKQDFGLTEFDFAAMQHKVILGWKAELAKAKYVRNTESVNYSPYVKADNVICNGEEACIEGDQYARQKMIFQPRHVDVSDDFYSLYIEDNLKWKRLEATAGLRVDYNRFLGKINFAHRLSGSYDIFGDQTTRLFTGFNRYYAGSMLAYKLRQGIGNNVRQSRTLNADGTLSQWGEVREASNSTYDVSNLDNPYSDEIVLGLAQRIFNSEWTLKWVRRNGRDQLMRETLTKGSSTYSGLTNNGWSKNDTITIDIKPLQTHKFKYAEVGYGFGASVNHTKTNSRWYDSGDFNEVEKAVYNDRLVDASNGLTPTDFNNPWKVFFNLNTDFPQLRLSWDQRFSYTGGKDYIQTLSTAYCNGSATTGNFVKACGDYVGKVQVYKDAHQASHFLVDWRFGYKQPTFREQFIELTLDVNNVLDKRAVAKSADGTTTYKMGRNFWFGVSYNW